MANEAPKSADTKVDPKVVAAEANATKTNPAPDPAIDNLKAPPIEDTQPDPSLSDAQQIALKELAENQRLANERAAQVSHGGIGSMLAANPPADQEEADARARVLAQADPARGTALAEAKADAEPIQCIAKKDFFDERGALIKAGETYFYQEQNNVVFPYPNLEPVSKARASAVRKEYEAHMNEQSNNLNLKARARDAFGRMISDTGI